MYTPDTYTIVIDETGETPTVHSIFKNGSVQTHHNVVTGLSLSDLMDQYGTYKDFSKAMKAVNIAPNYQAMIDSLPDATQSDAAHNPVIIELINLTQYLLAR